MPSFATPGRLAQQLPLSWAQWIVNTNGYQSPEMACGIEARRLKDRTGDRPRENKYGHRGDLPAPPMLRAEQ